MNIDLLYAAFIKAEGVTTDSRHCPVGSIFFALKGDNFDGNQYAHKALVSGCAYAVVDDASLVVDDRFFLVDDVLSTLQQLARHHRRVLSIPIIGITGSNGKTTTKELLAAVLSSKFKVHFTQGNFNNHIGVPLTLLGIKEEHQLAIVEMGANHPGEIADLCVIAEPDYGIITNIGKAHLEGFGGLEGVVATKKALYEFLRSRKGKVYVNAQDDLLMELSDGISRQCYNGLDAHFSVFVKAVLPSLLLEVNSPDLMNDELSTQMAGEYNLINIAAALEVGLDFGVDYESMKQALEDYESSNNRSQIIEKEHSRIILDAYNANPASMAVAVENFDKIDAPHKVVILGAMKELGSYSKDEHQYLLELIQEKQFDQMIVVGEEFQVLDKKPEAVHFCADLDEVEHVLFDFQDAIFLIKGSRGMKMEQLLDVL